jgi:methyl-accepting chemotaxis protein
VTAGANQISAGAQALSSGATQQTESLEEFSNSISKMTEMMKHSTQMAGQAAEFANSIKNSAEARRCQIEEIVTVTSQISDAGKSIRKIITMMNEIAFQTNILAMNASVEAVRAGKYGRSFAVVAQAVRDLAKKGAVAAKDTELLITNSIEKAELGVHIAEETSASLSEIVSAINENSRLVSEIATLSGEQSRNIEAINSGICQMSHVMRQNSMTAEDSAAASASMYEQSLVLQKLISRFKIKK